MTEPARQDMRSRRRTTIARASPDLNKDRARAALARVAGLARATLPWPETRAGARAGPGLTTAN